MRILNKYLLLMILQRAIFSLTALVIIFGFLKLLDELNHLEGSSYKINDAIIHTMFMLPSIANSLLTLAFLFGTVFTLGILNSNRETQVLLTGGISFKALIKKTLKFNLMLIIIFQVFFEGFSPQSYQMAQSIKNEKLKKNTSAKNVNFWTIKDNQFIFFDLLENNKVHFFEVDNNNLKNVMEGANPFFRDKTLVIDNISIKKINQDSRFAVITSIPSKKSTIIPVSENDFLILKKNYKEMSFLELIRGMVISIENGIESKNYFHELISRIIKPFNLLGMILISIPYILNIDRSASIGRMLFVSISIGILSSLITKFLTITINYFNSLSVLLVFVPTFVLIFLGVYLSKKKLN